jgi:hypothetical protein
MLEGDLAARLKKICLIALYDNQSILRIRW